MAPMTSDWQSFIQEAMHEYSSGVKLPSSNPMTNTFRANPGISSTTTPQFKSEDTTDSYPGYQDGGEVVPGQGVGDKIPIMAEPGEIVIPNEVVNVFGSDYFLGVIDAGKAIARRNGGLADRSQERPTTGPGKGLTTGVSPQGYAGGGEVQFDLDWKQKQMDAIRGIGLNPTAIEQSARPVTQEQSHYNPNWVQETKQDYARGIQKFNKFLDFITDTPTSSSAPVMNPAPAAPAPAPGVSPVQPTPSGVQAGSSTPAPRRTTGGVQGKASRKKSNRRSYSAGVSGAASSATSATTPDEAAAFQQTIDALAAKQKNTFYNPDSDFFKPYYKPLQNDDESAYTYPHPEAEGLKYYGRVASWKPGRGIVAEHTAIDTATGKYIPLDDNDPRLAALLDERQDAEVTGKIGGMRDDLIRENKAKKGLQDWERQLQGLERKGLISRDVLSTHNMGVPITSRDGTSKTVEWIYPDEATGKMPAYKTIPAGLTMPEFYRAMEGLAPTTEAEGKLAKLKAEIYEIKAKANRENWSARKEEAEIGKILDERGFITGPKTRLANAQAGEAGASATESIAGAGLKREQAKYLKEDKPSKRERYLTRKVNNLSTQLGKATRAEKPALQAKYDKAVAEYNEFTGGRPEAVVPQNRKQPVKPLSAFDK